MKVLMLPYHSLDEATSLRTINFAKYLSARGHDVEIITSKSERRFEGNENLRIHNVASLDMPRNPSIILSTLLKIAPIMSKGADIVHSFKTLPLTTMLAKLRHELRGTAFFADWDDYESELVKDSPAYLREPIKFFEDWIVKNSDCMTVVSAFLHELCKKSGVKSFLVPNGADTKLFRPIKDEAIRKKFALDNAPTIGYSGTLFRTTDLDMVIEAMPLVLKEIKEAMLVVRADGPKMVYFKEMIRHLGIEKNVVFLERVPYEELPKIYGMFDVAAMPFKDNLQNEARSPIKLAEYMACGLPVVSNSVGMAKVFLNNAKTLVKSQTAEEFAEKIVMVLSDGKMRERLGGESRKYAEKNLEWDVLSSNVEDAYRWRLDRQ